MKFYVKLLILLVSCLSISACDVFANRVAGIGRAPEFNRVKTYTDTNSDYAKAMADGVSYDELAEDDKPHKYSGSLWRTGARTFFRDQRARAVGDILKVTVSVQDTAKLDNKTERKRNGTASMGAPNLYGLESKYDMFFPSVITDPTKMFSVQSSDQGAGEGKVDRKETINTTIAATVVKILPNHNLYIKGSQEVRVNYEMREVTVEGIVRPEDISAENSVTLDQMAEARISYGGRGNLSDVQQERYGKQILDIISPF